MSWGDPLQGNPRYESIRTLSQGSRSFLQLALDRSTGEQVAIKFTQRGWDAGQAKYLLRELLIHQELSACRHPHIVELKDVFLTPLHLAAVMEHVEGEDLQTFLANTGGRVSEALGRFLFQQLVLAMSFVHARGKVCRGVKLANTLLALAPGQLPLVKLADFGFSKDVAAHSAPQSQVGTALFVAPEVMHNFNNTPYDGAAVDVWACGIVLFILLFGRHPFLRPEDSALPEQQQMLALFTRTAASQFCLLPEEAAAISPACADLLAHILQTNPTARYTMSQIQAHPWFKQGLPEGAAVMNATILADAASRPYVPRQAPEALAALVRAGQVLDPSLLSQRFAPAAEQQAWGAPPPARMLLHCTSSNDKRQEVMYKMHEQQQQQMGVPRPPILGNLDESTSSSAGSFVNLQQQQQYQQQQIQQQQQQVQQEQAQQQQQALLQPQQQFQQVQQQHYMQQHQQSVPQYQQQVQQMQPAFPADGGFLNMLQDDNQPAMAALAPQQMQPQQVQQLQQQMWQPQDQHTTSSGTTSMSGGVAGGTAGVASWGSSYQTPSAATAPSATAGDVQTASGTSGRSLQQNINALNLQQQQQVQQEQVQQPPPFQQQLPNVSSGPSIAKLNSADLEALIPLEVLDQQQQQQQQQQHSEGHGIVGIAVAPDGPNTANLGVFASMSSLPPLPSLDVDALLHPDTNPLLTTNVSADYNQQQQQLQQLRNHHLQKHQDAHDAFSNPSDAAAAGSPGKPQHRLLAAGDQQQRQSPATSSAGQGGVTAANGGNDTGVLHDNTNDDDDQTAAAAAGEVEIPEDYAAFLVDEDDIAAASAGRRSGSGAAGAAAVAARRKRVLSGVGAGASSLSLDLRQLSDMLMASEAQLREGSLWHKICSDMSFRERSGLFGSTETVSGGVDGVGANISDGEVGLDGVAVDNDNVALQGLRDMSITRGA